MNAIDLLRNSGIKKTAQRVSIINILLKKDIPLEEREIKEEMGDMYDRITFYRTIQTLLEAGIIHRITVDNVAVKYAMNDARHHGDHVHFYCIKCHSVTCLHSIALKKYTLPEGYVGESCEILIKGLCANCSQDA